MCTECVGRNDQNCTRCRRLVGAGADYSRKSRRAALTWSLWVQAMACGPPSMTLRVRPLTRSGSRPPVSSSGSTRSESPWMTRIGTSKLATSARKSVCQVGTHATAAMGEPEAAMLKLFWNASSLTREPRVDVHVVEVLQEPLEPGQSVGGRRSGEPVEQRRRRPDRVVVGLQEERRDRGDQHRFADPCGAVGAQVAGDLTGAHRMPDQYCVLQVQMLDEGVVVGGEGVVVVAGGRLAGLPPAPAVVQDHPVTGRQQHRHLLLPCRSVQRIPMGQHHRGTGTVVLVVDLDVAGVLSTDFEVRHHAPPCRASCAGFSKPISWTPSHVVRRKANGHPVHSVRPAAPADSAA